MVSQPTMSSASLPPQPAVVELAARGTRLGARFIDGLLAVPFLFFWIIGVSLFNSEAGEIIGFILFLMCILALIVYQWYLLSTEGQTIGKRMLNIKIIKLDGTNGGFVTNVLMREILNGLIGIIPLYSLVDILFIFSEEQRCIHDHIATTKVIRV